MKKLIPIFLLLICGCATGAPHILSSPAPPPRYITMDVNNAYFENIYITYYYGDLKKLPFLKDPSTGWDGCGIGCEHRPLLNDDRNPLIKLWVFQDINRKCLLYSYTKEELIELRKDAVFSITDNYPGEVFLLEKTGIRVVLPEEYEKLKPTLKPHRYDPSLCKPEPNWSKYSTDYRKIRTKSDLLLRNIKENMAGLVLGVALLSPFFF